MAETVTSSVEPEAANGGKEAVTMTAAAFLELSEPLRILVCSRSIMLFMLSSSCGQLRTVSPVPFRPTTRP